MILASGVHGTRGAKWNTESKTKPSEKNVNRNYAKHLGIITVGVSKAHILKLLRDPTIRMVIPYHKSGLNAQVAAALKIAFYEDFTDVQNTMLLKKDGSTVGLSKDGAKIGDKNISDFNFYKYFGKEIDGVFYDGKATAAKYLEWCEKGEYNEDIGEYGYYLTDGSFITKAELDAKGLSVLPKFGEFAAEENYYKLIEDFDCYDTITGEHSSQEAVDFFHDGLPADYKNVLVTALKAEQKVSDDFRDHLDNHGLRDEVMDIVKARGYTPSIKKQAKKKNAENFVEDKYFRTQMQKWDSLTHGAYVKVGEIKEEHPLVKVGMPQGIIRYDVDKLNKNMEKHKYLNTDLLNEIPNIIANPIAISEYTEENTVSVFGDVFVGNSPMMVGVTISKDRSGANISKVRTFNARRDVGTLITNETVLYLNEDKKRTLNWFQACGIQVPLGETKFGFIRSISHKDKTVKKQLKKDSSSYAPTFYSQMGKVVEGIKMDKIGAASVVNFLKGKGIKHDEIKWSGIETFLEGKKSVTKAELQEFIEGSQLQIEENVRDDRWNGVKVKRVSKNVAEAYVDGELLSTFTKIEGGWWQSDKDSYLSAGSFHDIKRAATILLEIDTKWSEYTLDGGKNYREITFKLPNSNYSNGAMQGHWGDNAKGIIAHARIQDFKVNGKKMLFIEEIQSDWHNAGHKEGYEGDDSVLREKLSILNKQWLELYDKMINAKATEVRGITEKMDSISDEQNKLEKKLKFGEFVPDAPFKDNYHEYVLKSLLRTAAENGYDSIGWTPADVQSERWSDEYAEGYRIEYDQDIPKFLKKYGKQWGATVGSTVLNNGTEVWSMDITEPMEQAVLYEGQAKFQKKKVSNRTILSNALESAIDTSTQAGQNELKWLKQYQGKIDTIEKEEAHLAEVNAEIKELSFGKDTDRSRLKDLKLDKVMTVNRINTYDRQLMRLEAMKPIKDILAREKEMVRKRTEEKGREALANYRKEALKVRNQMIGEARRETRQKISESRSRTEMRHKIKKVVSELNQLLLNGTKDKHVTEGLQKAVAMALDAFNMDTVDADNRIAKYNALIAKATDPDVIASLTETRDRIQKMGDRMSNKLTALKEAYNNIINSSDPSLANAYDKVITNYIESVAERVGDTPIRNMSLEQLDDVYAVYKMVLTTIRNFNKAFKMAKTESISSLSNKVMMEVEKVGGSKTHVLGGKLGSALSLIKKFDFNNMKPVYAFEKIGSSTLSKLFENVRKGEDVWAVDITEAKDFKEETSKKYNYKKWDFDKVYSFKTSTGNKFTLTLDQIMSLYAYSKREQALPHLAEGGFVFDDSIETHKETVEETKNGKKVKRSFFKYKVNTAAAHKISAFEVADIVGKLTTDQKAFVDEMQAYLSDVMGAKGNEVALAMYDVKLFKEKNYFPLKSAKQYMFEQNEVAGEVKIKNSSFSQGTVKHANNPVILSNFMDVWANHVNDMSMYHAFVLPLEDFNRVFNYKTPASQSLDEESVKGFIQNAYGRHANEYISQLIKDLNGGARVDPRETVSKNMIGKFKKASVFGSASVIIQQPSAVGRALALIGAKYFDFNPKLISHNKLWAEVKKYAPVAIIKEMGHFDIDMGASTVDYIKGEKTFMEKADDVIAKLASFMDELTWVHIWAAVKREVKANNKDLSGEAYLQKCGERFTEVVTKTQVYDSVLSRSANMRSKSVFMNMLTSFMAEPTTSINMLEDAMTKFSRGEKGKASRQIASVAASVILNSMLVAFVYGARDDDEDETYWEKYIGSLTAEVIDGSNPITYYPILKDIWSIAQGFDVERSDMTLISKAVDSLKNVVTTMMTDTEDMDEDELAEHNKAVVDSWLGVAGEFSSLFGIPAKNLIRDIKAGFNVYNTANNGAEGSWSLLWDAVAESAVSTVPVVGWFAKESKSDKLYDVIVAGDTASINRMKSGYKDDKAYNTAVRTALRENDPRIKEAAEARFNGDMTRYKEIAYQIKGEGKFTQDNIVAAITTEYNKLKSATKEETSESKSPAMYNYADYYNAIINGDANDIAVVKDYLIESGKTEKNIESNLNSNRYVDFKADYPEYKDTITESRFANYYEPMEDYYGRSIADTGLSFSSYSEYCVKSAECTGIDADGDGKADSGTKKAEVMNVINSLPISIAQKDALYFLNGWSKKTLFKEAPWR